MVRYCQESMLRTEYVPRSRVRRTWYGFTIRPMPFGLSSCVGMIQHLFFYWKTTPVRSRISPRLVFPSCVWYFRRAYPVLVLDGLMQEIHATIWGADLKLNMCVYILRRIKNYFSGWAHVYCVWYVHFIAVHMAHTCDKIAHPGDGLAHPGDKL